MHHIEGYAKQKYFLKNRLGNKNKLNNIYMYFECVCTCKISFEYLRNKQNSA